MKAKNIRRTIRRATAQAYTDNLRVIWARLCQLRRRERVRLAWMLLRRDADLNKFLEREE